MHWVAPSAKDTTNDITIEEGVDWLIGYRGKMPLTTKSGVRFITAKVVKGRQICREPAEYVAADLYDERRPRFRILDEMVRRELFIA